MLYFLKIISYERDNMQNKKLIMAYLAGVMDGDGSFSLIKMKKGSLNPLYAPMLQCGSWRIEFIHLLKDTFGGNFVKRNPIARKDGSMGHELLIWKLRSGINVKPAVLELLPYLHIKKEVAETVLKFIENCPFVRGKVLQQQELIKREALYLQAVQLNDWKTANYTITTKLARSNTIDPLFWSYIAGLMDTDGSFSVKKQTKNKGTHVINPRYLPVISLSMTDTSAINYIRENCNLGKLYIPKNMTTSCGIHYQFGIYTKRECIEFLKNVLPHLRSKKENAQVLMAFCENSKNTKICIHGVPEEELAYREQCYQQLCQLNKYGVYKSPLIILKTQTDNAEGNKEQAGDKPCSLNAVSEENFDNEVCGTLNSDRQDGEVG
jgi:hypothetical protein